MLHTVSFQFPLNSSHCIWTSSHEMLGPYILKPLNLSQAFSKYSGINFGISGNNINTLCCSLRIPLIMASGVSTAVTTQKDPVPTQDESTQNAAPRPLQVNPLCFCFSFVRCECFQTELIDSFSLF